MILAKTQGYIEIWGFSNGNSFKSKKDCLKSVKQKIDIRE